MSVKLRITAFKLNQIKSNQILFPNAHSKQRSDFQRVRELGLATRLDTRSVYEERAVISNISSHIMKYVLHGHAASSQSRQTAAAAVT